MINKYKELTEDDIKFLNHSNKHKSFVKFDIVLSSIGGRESQLLETLESEFGIYFNDEDEKLLSKILAKHGYMMRKVTLTCIEKREK